NDEEERTIDPAKRRLQRCHARVHPNPPARSQLLVERSLHQVDRGSQPPATPELRRLGPRVHAAVWLHEFEGLIRNDQLSRGVSDRGGCSTELDHFGPEDAARDFRGSLYRDLMLTDQAIAQRQQQDEAAVKEEREYLAGIPEGETQSDRHDVRPCGAGARRYPAPRMVSISGVSPGASTFRRSRAM